MKVLSSGLPERVGDGEELIRFLTSSRLFSSNGIKPAAFLPNPKNGETSVFRYDIEEQVLWQIGEELVAGERTLHGAAVFKARHARDAGLDVVSAEPPPRHSNIIGWPQSLNDPDMAKAKQKERAIMIAQYAKFLPRR